MSMLGWLDRAGVLHPADYMKHYDVAIEAFKKPDWQLEAEGIVKIYIDHIAARHNMNNQRGTDNVYYIQSPNRLSKEQVNWLLDNNFMVYEDDMPL